MSMDHSYRVFEPQPLQAERDSMRADRSGLGRLQQTAPPPASGA